jgi:hypothetical protein
MGAVTYPHPDVCRYVDRYLVPVQVNVQEDPAAVDEFNSAWTPTVLIQDAEGREYRRSVGYLDPGRLLGELALGRLHEAIHRGEAERALERVADALERTRGDAAREPEARYFAAVARYKTTKDPATLASGWNELLDRFPESDWARKAAFIRG